MKKVSASFCPDGKSATALKLKLKKVSFCPDGKSASASFDTAAEAGAGLSGEVAATHPRHEMSRRWEAVPDPRRKIYKRSKEKV